MNLDWSKCCIVNGAWQSWYERGSIRLEQSLINVGFKGTFLTYRNDPNFNEFFKPQYPYTIKTACIDEAIKKGFTKILWVDCSCWAIKPVDWFFETIENELFYATRSGAFLSQTSTDSDLVWAGVTRDEAEKLNECWSAVFGFDYKTEQGKKFWELMKDGTIYGVCSTPRTHSGLSKDPRYLYPRNDQTLVSHIFHKVGHTKFYPHGEYVAYDDPNYTRTENTIFLIKGGI